MGNIKGIRIDLRTGTQSWAATGDKIFLGIHGTAGGREFRLDGSLKLNQANQDHRMVLGVTCCDTPGYQQVQYSTALGDNDPLLSPLDLASVRYVYVRKETADSTSTNDDVLVLNNISVLLCDADGGVRRFAKRGKINFSDEVGLQHWLAEVDPPTCQVTIVLKRIRHEKAAKHTAGNSWAFTFSAGPPDNHASYLNNYNLKEKKDSWDKEFNRTASWKYPGCCGHAQTLSIYGKAVEDDIGHDDVGEWTREITAPCHSGTSTESAELQLSVKGIKNHESLITFEYDVISTCLD
ncbi:MAG: hypothetical protein QOH71_1736 [Blastocatellia bacterium]|jgi:hypothetical protein|nr:hypothetical protein [Blastocatellia bacterium]